MPPNLRVSWTPFGQWAWVLGSGIPLVYYRGYLEVAGTLVQPLRDTFSVFFVHSFISPAEWLEGVDTHGDSMLTPPVDTHVDTPCGHPCGHVLLQTECLVLQQKHSTEDMSSVAAKDMSSVATGACLCRDMHPIHHHYQEGPSRERG